MIFTPREAWAYIGGLSEPSKMPCYSYSIHARNCKTGSKLAKIPGTVCSKCYGFRGHYPLPNVLKKQRHRIISMSKPYWVSAMVTSIASYESSGYFRFFDVGDVQNLSCLIKICEVCRQLPRIKFWLPTREDKILKAYINAGYDFPSNLVIRFSATRFEERPTVELLRELNILGSNVSKIKWNCPSYLQNNQCLSCRACWNKSRKIITYMYH